MRITSRELKSIFRETWPKLGHYQIMLDPFFELPTFDEIKRYFDESKVHEFEFIDYFFDCDDFAFAFIHEVKMKRYEARESLPKPLLRLALGAAFTPGDNLVVPDHMLNLCRTADRGSYMIDLTDKTMRPAERSDDVRLTIF